MKFRKIKHIHFVGIGGIGMSGIAELLLNLGFDITGSDISNNENVKRLKRIGVMVFRGHKPENMKNCDVLVYSSAVSLNNSGAWRSIKAFLRSLIAEPTAIVSWTRFLPFKTPSARNAPWISKNGEI